jgi:hypothetical protein
MAYDPPAAFKHIQTWTTSDTVRTPWVTHGIYVSVTGALNITDESGAQNVLTSVPVGWLPIKAKQIWATGTTATVTLIAN